MAKTYNKRSSKNKTMKNRKNTCKHNATMHALNHWYEEMFEKLGWMVLAKSWGDMEDKIISYKKSLLRLRDHLACKIDSVNDKDKKKDLYIMWTNVEVLIKHANKDL